MSVPRSTTRARRWRSSVSIVAATLTFGVLAPLGATSASAASSITIVAREVGTDALIPNFKFLINENNAHDAGDPNPPTLSGHESFSPVVMAGDQADASGINLPDGRYLITVQAAGYKLWGTHVTLPDEAGTVTVQLLPHPLPLATLKVHVFEDNASVNAADDRALVGPGSGLERGLPNFSLILEDGTGEVTVDYYGNPLCGGQCITDANGDITVENLPPGKYGVQAVPPEGPGAPDWIQTTTIEGTHVIDVWLEEGATGLSTEEGATLPAASFGFVEEEAFPVAPGTFTVTGTARNDNAFPFGAVGVGDPIDRPWIALSDVGRDDTQVYTGRGNADGTFSIPNVPPGNYQLSIWDDPLDYIITFVTVNVTDQNVALGDIGVPRWFGWQTGSVFQDDDEDGLRDPGEAGIPHQDLDIRFRDGSIAYATFTNTNGKYRFDEVFPFPAFLVSEVGFGRFAATGASGWTTDDADQDPDVDAPKFQGGPGTLLTSSLTWFGMRNHIDWGKRPYDETDPADNGGISGIVYHAATRNEFDARLAAAEDYETGIPDVTVQLWDLGANGEWDGGTGDDSQINEVTTDHYQRPTGCDVLNQDGSPFPDPLSLGPNCVETVAVANEIKPGVFDGGYAFTNGCPAGTFPCDDADKQPLLPNDYVVKVIEPDHFQIVREEDQNTDQGDVFPTPAVAPAECVGPLHLVDDPRNPFDGEMRPLCDERLVTLDTAQNAAADFFMFVDNGIQLPGRFFGYVFDDLNVETDPNRVNFAEKAGVANLPVGIRDFTGRLLTTVYTDADGGFDVLVPSTQTINCPTPGGICPAMYNVVANDPGDAADPNPGFNTAYPTMKFPLNISPGKTTYADLAILPGGNPVDCGLAPGTPELHNVSQVTVTGTSRTITIRGLRFGASPGAVTLGGRNVTINSWAARTIVVTVPTTLPGGGSWPRGPQQLVVKTSTGRTPPTGMTIHVLGSGYNPAVRTVGPAGIQAAIDAAPVGAIVVVPQGRYLENVVLHKGIRLQGVGPGRASGADGAVIDGGNYIATADQWQAKIDSITFDGGPPLTGAGVTVLGRASGWPAARVDGLRIARASHGQGGGVYVHGYAPGTAIANDVIMNNSGQFGGGIVLGRPYQGDRNNDNITITDNRILNNGGFRLAGGLGIFRGADNYRIERNEICGNYASEYGGGISHFGTSPNGLITQNRIVANYAFDEGGGILVGGQFSPGALGTKSGPVTIERNVIQGNLSNDDGGGIRLLAPRDSRIDITNNMVVNNVATDIGGGIALDDASNVRIVNNTIANNETTATAIDSDHLPHGAGLSTTPNSTLFQATLPVGAPTFSRPVTFVNNIFWNNRAFGWDGAMLTGPTVIDMEVVGATDLLAPRYSVLTNGLGVTPSGTNEIGVDPGFRQGYLNVLRTQAFFLEGNFIDVEITNNVTSPPFGDYHLSGTGSVAVNEGTSGGAPSVDIDGQGRPFGGGIDIGADEVRP